MSKAGTVSKAISVLSVTRLPNARRIPVLEAGRCLIAEKPEGFVCSMPQVRHFRSVFLMLLAAVLIGCGGTQGEVTNDSVEAAAGPPPALVRVRDVRHESVAAKIVTVGTVRARYSSIVASGSDGIVDEFTVEQGDFVKAGMVLSRLRMVSTDLEIAQQKALTDQKAAEYAQTLTPRKELVEEAKARQAVADVSFANAKRRLEELRRLQESRAAGESAVKDAEDAFSEASQNLIATRAIYERIASGAREEEKLQARAALESQQKYVEFLEAEKEKRITRAPFDGYVVQRHSYLGQWLSKGSPVVTMVQLNDVDVEVQVDQSQISQVFPGKSVILKIAGAEGRSDPSGQWQGKVDSIVSSSNWESGSRSFPVIIRVQNELREINGSHEPVLRQGMMAEAEFFGESVDAVMVPKDSLVRTSRGTFIFAVNPPEPGKPLSVRQVQVEPGISVNEWIQVQGTDLQAGVQVVTEGGERLRAFQTVQIVSENDVAGPGSAAASSGGG